LSIVINQNSHQENVSVGHHVCVSHLSAGHLHGHVGVGVIGEVVVDEE